MTCPAVFVRIAFLCWAGWILAPGILPHPAYSATITIVNQDGPGEGLNDPAPVAPVGGNAGATLGEQRLNVFERAAEIWGARLESPVEILVAAQFNPLFCDSSSATLGQARAATYFRDFVGAPRPGTFYAVALANQFAGRDLDPGEPDILATFNSGIGSDGCVPSVAWYYGLDGNPPTGTFELLQTILHELAHGFGFSTLLNLESGTRPNGIDDAYMLQLEDHSTGKHFGDMTDAERLAAVTDSGDLHWTGDQVIAAGQSLSSGRHPQGHVEIYAPNPLESGSSVSHFSTSLAPDDLMEPFANRSFESRLTLALLQDLGWPAQTDAPIIVPAEHILLAETCSPANLAADPGESVTVEFRLRNTGQGLTENLTVTLLASANVLQPSAPQSYGILPAGGSPVGRTFTFGAAGQCGQSIAAMFQLEDSGVDLGTVTFDLVLGFVPAQDSSFANATALAIPATGKSGPAAPYPSEITVTGYTNPLQKITVILAGLSHDNAADLDVLLVAPGGEGAVLMSDAGSASLNGATLTLDDEAANALPASGGILSGTYRPTNQGGGDFFPSPAPAGPYHTSLASLALADPNGVWKLFIVDDNNPGGGQLQGGWSLQLISGQAPVCCDNSDNLADLEVVMRAHPLVVSLQSNLTFTTTLTNLGPDPAAGVQLVNPLPAGTALLSHQASQGTCQESNRTLFCNLGVLPPQDQAVVEVYLTGLQAGPLTNQATATTLSTDPNPLNNSASAAASINAPPALLELADVEIPEDATPAPMVLPITDPDTSPENLTVTARAADTNLIPSATLRVDFVPPNYTLSITPAPDQNGLTGVAVLVSDGWSTVSDIFLVDVVPVNDPPILRPVEDQIVHQGSRLVLTNAATDVDDPASALSFSLAMGPPEAILNPVTGLFTWEIPPLWPETTNLITLTVSDDGTPPLEDSESFAVTVLPGIRILGITMEATRIIIDWESVPGEGYHIQAKTNLQDAVWQDLTPPVIATETRTRQSVPRQSVRQFYRIRTEGP